jgi:hypothetical protein
MKDKFTPNELLICRVAPEQMRRLFNHGRYWDKVKSGELTAHVLQSRVSRSLPYETVEILSQMVSYRDLAGQEIARVHQYLRPDGTIAASGKPDPKRLLEGRTLYRLEKKSA